MRRKALKPLKMFGSTEIQRGEWVCVPQQAMMNNPSLYPTPAKFSGTRFLPDGEEGEAKMSLFTDSNDKWLIWGHGSTTWYVNFIRVSSRGFL